MIKILKKLNRLLDKKQKSFMVVLFIMMLFGAALETASVAIIIPAVTLLMDSDAVNNNALVAGIYNFLGFTSNRTFIIFVMCSLIFAFVFKNIYLYIQQKVLFRFIYTNQFRTSERMMKNYMRKDYEYYLNADTAVIQRNITSDVNNMYALILSLMQLYRKA